MKCPFCSREELKVIDSRDAGEFNGIRRRRECLHCTKRFTTFEIIEIGIQVHKRDGRYEDFQIQKLILGMEAACRHTKISKPQVAMIASEIESEILQAQVKEISTQKLGEVVMRHLKLRDPIAYIRFACVYKRFKNIDELKDALMTIHAKD